MSTDNLENARATANDRGDILVRVALAIRPVTTEREPTIEDCAEFLAKVVDRPKKFWIQAMATRSRLGRGAVAPLKAFLAKRGEHQLAAELDALLTPSIRIPPPKSKDADLVSEGYYPRGGFFVRTIRPKKRPRE